ncbi:translation initiation factor IF-3 [Blattabacterium sp. (Blaberus giganteus)]|uniref:translation initiation factor IF-3 n=1 Tax=Blattabacterium sp. (Blaberus giganteus) TaxID=1186051 RepID=UPI00025F6EA9|nr:translation initiation factor IF-3 [Blattabacterium sp. (Blaberus giganteus)]AFJ90625.1 translation initiation factor IF-3 [Blattabacterium sp. (Blaberus giganteus)]
MIKKKFSRGNKRNRIYRPFLQKKEEHRINDSIDTPKVRLVGASFIENGIYSIQEAIQFSRERELDLVEINPKLNPPVCKILDYKKFLYEQKKRKKQFKAKQIKVNTKEIRFGPQIGDHDGKVKIKSAEKFLMRGDKVKVFVFFKGRSIVYKDQGKIKLLKFAEEIEEYGKVEQMPIMEGKRMYMILAPKKF